MPSRNTRHCSADEKESVVDGTSYRYSTDWIHRLESEDHWRLYWQQQKLMEGVVTGGDRVLEIGVGSGFTANYLRSKGVLVTTLDLDPDKNPDIVANVVTYEFPQQYDHILAFEVFEHIPFEQFEKVLGRIRRSCQSHLFLSVPRCERTLFRASLKLPFLKSRSWQLVARRGRLGSQHHFWEVDHGQITFRHLLRTFERTGYHVEIHKKRFGRFFLRCGSPT